MFNEFIITALEKGVDIETAKLFISQYYKEESGIFEIPKNSKRINFYLFGETIYQTESYILYDKSKCVLEKKESEIEKVYIHFDFKSYMKYNEILLKDVLCYKFCAYFDTQPNVINNIIDMQRGVLIDIANIPF